ncbi:hypothetical protein TNCT_320031 [Trichonephila clavata]|uniref:Uncharacterized protein n=1 Tax=Trichonephila clavata TaxID=2740835 RepID=A0A8X6F561_TRICU|nr:hypothetical protein TNCT_320031 [Trichonephila clavata]
MVRLKASRHLPLFAWEALQARISESLELIKTKSTNRCLNGNGNRTTIYKCRNGAPPFAPESDGIVKRNCVVCVFYFVRHHSNVNDDQFS